MMTAIIQARGLIGADGTFSPLPKFFTKNYTNSQYRVVLAALIIGAFLIFLTFSCITARRRRRQGQQPWRGTGWAAGVPPPGHGPAQYTGAPPQQYNGNPNAAAPPYSPPANQGYYGQGYNSGSNQGYFGGQQQGVELQQPENAYARGGENVFSPPAGPPPGKKAGDGIIR